MWSGVCDLTGGRLHNIMVVRDMMQQCLLGTDFLEQCHCVINMDTKTLTIAGHPHPVQLSVCPLPSSIHDDAMDASDGDIAGHSSSDVCQRESVCFLSTGDPKQLQQGDSDLQQVIIWVRDNAFPSTLPRYGSYWLQTLWSQNSHLLLKDRVLSVQALGRHSWKRTKQASSVGGTKILCSEYSERIP